MIVILWGMSLLAMFVAGCRSAGVTDYRASPVLSEQDWGDRLHLSWGDVRVVAGPVSVFPYERERADGGWERGQYQLFTQLMVHNTGREPVDVNWGGATLEGPAGERIRLVDTDRAAGARRSGAGAGGGRELVERVEPGHRTGRALIPETIREIGVGEPMVPLCDGCLYRLVLPVRIEGREERLVLPFRLTAQNPAVSGRG